MNIHQLIAKGIIIASDEGADIIVILDDESGNLIAYTGREGEYSEETRHVFEEEADDLAVICETAEDLLDELVNVEGETIDGTAEQLDD
jgi:hypothetical protein